LSADDLCVQARQGEEALHMIGKPGAVASFDVADDGLIDARSLGLGRLIDESDQSSLARALERILATDEDSVPQNGFSNQIGA
jgi:hypothetical protein